MLTKSTAGMYVTIAAFILTLGATGLSQSRSLDDQATETEDSAKYDQFRTMLNNVALVGHFTIDGRDSENLREERYEIKSVRKMPNGDYWLFTARVQYGDKDVTLPMPLEVKWAENTPMISLDNVTIPVLGTFNARVIFDNDRYAGTWQHGEVGGHLFGKIEKMTRPANSNPTDADNDSRDESR